MRVCSLEGACAGLSSVSPPREAHITVLRERMACVAQPLTTGESRGRSLPQAVERRCAPPTGHQLEIGKVGIFLPGRWPCCGQVKTDTQLSCLGDFFVRIGTDIPEI